MNDEIKEILECLKKHDILNGSQDIYLYDYITDLQQKYEISQKDIQSLKNNYNDLVKISENKITNLQEDLEKANDIIEKDRQFYKCRMDEYVELKKENEFLKLNNPEMNIEHFRIIKENKIKIDRLRKENQQLKEDIKFCINTMKNEYECTDKRTNRELHTIVEILEKWTKEYKEGSV